MDNNQKFAFTKTNYLMLSAGVILIIIGLFFMQGGESKDLNTHNVEEMFGFRRITLAPIIIVGGFVLNIFAILYKPRK
ncbi:DUF3098 domain-containing protein [bacterium]|nr:DUF3098 domain-containing protein [bacterium]